MAVNPAQAAGVNIAIDIGGSTSQRNSTETSDTARGSAVAAGGDVRIAAVGGGEQSNLLVQGSDITAGHDATLVADNEVQLLAARNDWSRHATNKGSAASIGVSFGTSGFLVNASASAARGKSDGTDTVYGNAHVKAGNRASVASGGDTTLQGANIEADSVHADIGGNLAIASLQDTSKSTSKQQSAGGSLSVGFGVWSASANLSSARASGDYASVTEPSGIKAGDGGFDVRVEGHTGLKGAVLSSTQAAVDEGLNSFETASLSTSDIVNRDSAKAAGASLGLGAAGASGASGPTRMGTGGAAGTGNASGSQASTTRAGISGVAGDMTVRSEVDGANALTREWDTDRLVADVQAQAQIAQQFGQRASSAWGSYANNQLRDALERNDEEAARCWAADGACRVAGHGVIGGLPGGTSGAAGATAGTALVPSIDRVAAEASLSGAVRDAVVVGLAGAIGSALGGPAGGAAAFNEVNNNYLTSHDVNQLASKLSQCTAGDTKCKEAIRAEAKAISKENNKNLLACNDQNCVDEHIGELVKGAKTFNTLYESDEGTGKSVFGALSDIQTTGGLIAANMSAGYTDYPRWKQANCEAITDAACNSKFSEAAARGEILGSNRPSGVLQWPLQNLLRSTSSPHQYTHSGIVCAGSDETCKGGSTFDVLRQYAGPGAPGSGKISSGSVTDIQLLGYLRLGYVTHLVDQSSLSIVNITLPGQHGLDPGWVVRSVHTNSYGQTFVNSYGAGTGANPLDANVWGANFVWGSNINAAVRPLSSSATVVNDILCQRFGSCK